MKLQSNGIKIKEKLEMVLIDTLVILFIQMEDDAVEIAKMLKILFFADIIKLKLL